MNEIEGIGLKSRIRLTKVIEAAKGSVTPIMASKALNMSQQEAGRMLSRWCKAGWLRRIKRGFYIPIPVESSPEKMAIENPWIVVTKLFEPGYIAGFSAIKHWDLSEQIFETTSFFTTKKIKNRKPHLSGIRTQLKTIAKTKLFGTKIVWIGSTKIQVSDPSKTIVDLLDDPAMVGGMRIVSDLFKNYLDSEYKKIDLLIEYAERMKNKTIYKRLGFLLEILNGAEPKSLEKIRSLISRGYSEFDPTIDNKRILRRWNLKVPSSWMVEYDRKK